MKNKFFIILSIAFVFAFFNNAVSDAAEAQGAARDISIVAGSSTGDINNLILSDPGLIIKVNVKPFFNSGIATFFNTGELKKVQDEIFGEFEKRTGLSFMRDINELMFCMSSKIDFKAKSPNNLALFLTGNFDSEKLMSEIEKEESMKDAFGKKGNFKTIKGPDVEGMFIGKNAFVVAPEDVIGQFADNKFKSGVLAGDVKKALVSSSIFAYAALTPEFKEMAEPGLRGIPPAVKDAIGKANSLMIYNEGLSLVVRAEFSDAAFCSDLKKQYESLRGMIELQLSARRRDIDEKIKAATLMELLNKDLAGMKTAFAVGEDFLKMLELNVDGKTMTFKFNVNDEYAKLLNSAGGPLTVIAVMGMAAGLAEPYLKHSRRNSFGNVAPLLDSSDSWKKTCVSNMKTLEGACELYAMEKPKGDNPKSVDQLVNQGYLKKAPNCPEGGEYSIKVKNDGMFLIECSKHGKID